MTTEDIAKPSAKALLDAKIKSALKEFQNSTGQKLQALGVERIPVLGHEDKFVIQVECI